VFKPLPVDDPQTRQPDITLARTRLGWEPKIPLAEGLKSTVEYFRQELIREGRLEGPRMEKAV
jgi:UDP-glucuronate decarboxylase